MPTITSLSIASSGTTSTSADLGQVPNPVGFILPTMTGTTIDLETSDDNSTFVKVYDRFGNKVTITPSVGLVYLEPEVGFSLFRYIRLVSGSAESSARTIRVLTRIIS